MNPDGSPGVLGFLAKLMFVGGFAAGPVYYFYCDLFSGKEVAQYEVRWQGGEHASVVLPLDPGMNPIVLELSAFVPGMATGQSVSFGMTVDDGPTRLAAGTLRIGSSRKTSTDGRVTQVLDPIAVSRADRYTARVWRGRPDPTGIPARDVRVHVRANAKAPNMKTVWWGVGILAAGVLLGMATGALKPVNRSSMDS